MAEPMETLAAVQLRKEYTQSERNDDEQVRIMWKWFKEWDSHQRKLFLESLVPKVVPNKLFSQLSRLNMKSSSQNTSMNVYECQTFENQLRFIHSCLDNWTADKANDFVTGLEEIDRTAVYTFYDMIAATVGEV